MNMEDISLENKIESYLLYKGDAVSLATLASVCGVNESEIMAALDSMAERFIGRAFNLVREGSKVALVGAPETQGFIESIQKDEMAQNLGDASLETLSLILYRSPIRKSEIDYIRGVNSVSTIRNLLTRGLIEERKSGDAIDYSPTIDALRHLGVSSISKLPHYSEIRDKLAQSHIEG